MDDFREAFLTFSSSAFRLESLPEYKVDYETVQFQKFLKNEEVTYDHDENVWWMEMVRNKTSYGATMSRAHVITTPLTDYLRFEMSVAYPHTSAAGEDIRLIDEEDFDIICEVEEFDVAFNRWGSLDFWLFDDTRLYIMDYDDEGRWLGQNETFDGDDIKDAMRIRDEVLRASSPFYS